ncbi:MAG: hypothetical protein A3I66_04685 [Burkholderiales bacterium RIFCSPLOWO2_02_FULL_57_36]|nr:MAG: hypothetical protein A3I66_04685 [Burkholderiales bacterium RIFCSPLOWO2_02_FULL_57_36]
MTKILIIGATGNIGSLTAAALAARYPEKSLRLTSSRASGCAQLREQYPAAEIMCADWYDLTSLTAAMQGVEKVFVVTPDFVTDELVATNNMIGAAKAAPGLLQMLRMITMPPGLTAADLEPEVLATRCGANLSVVAKPLLDASGLPVTYINVASWIMFNLPWFLAEEVRATRRLAMPAKSNTPRLWLSEADIAEAAAKILADDAALHLGKEYMITGSRRYAFQDVADMLSEVLGENVSYADDDAAFRRTMGENFNTIMTYFKHETRDYAHLMPTDTFRQLVGRAPVELSDYLQTNKAMFI